MIVDKYLILSDLQVVNYHLSVITYQLKKADFIRWNRLYFLKIEQKRLLY